MSVTGLPHPRKKKKKRLTTPSSSSLSSFLVTTVCVCENLVVSIEQCTCHPLSLSIKKKKKTEERKNLTSSPFTSSPFTPSSLSSFANGANAVTPTFPLDLFFTTVVVVVAALLRGVAAVAFPLPFAAVVVLVTRPPLVRLAGVGVGASTADDAAAKSSSSSLSPMVGVPPVVGVGVVPMLRYLRVIWPKRVCGGDGGLVGGWVGGWGLDGKRGRQGGLRGWMGEGKGLKGWHRCCGWVVEVSGWEGDRSGREEGRFAME